MAKTKPIGVRFDLAVLKKIQNETDCTPQGVLSKLETYYLKNENIDKHKLDIEMRVLPNYAVYALVNSIDKTIFYIGVSNDIIQRKKEHTYLGDRSMKYLIETKNETCHGEIARILKEGGKIEQEVIEELPINASSKDALIREKYWINWCIKNDFKITNVIRKGMKNSNNATFKSFQELKEKFDEVVEENKKLKTMPQNASKEAQGEKGISFMTQDEAGATKAVETPKKHKLWKEGDPPEGSNAFYLRKGCRTYDQLENMEG